jgi:hypothetical protein
MNHRVIHCSFLLAGVALMITSNSSSALPVSPSVLLSAVESLDPLVVVRGGRGGGARGGGHVSRGGGAHVSRGGGAHVSRGTGHVNRSANVTRHTNVNRNVNRNVNVNRHVGVGVGAVRPWVRRPYFGTVVGGVALGTLIAATAVPAVPAPGLCWYWTDSSQTQGYWDYCQ